jgi:hypothetical protein
MTATVTELRPVRGDSRTVRYEAIRRTAQQELEQAITEAVADERITRYAHTALDAETRNDAYELLKDSLARVSCLNMPGGCPCHDFSDVDTQDAEDSADADAHHATKQLLGERP